MKASIAECNAALYENFKAENFTEFNQVLNRLLALSLFDEDNLQKIHKRANSYLNSAVVRLDTVDVESIEDEYLREVVAGAIAFGYKYFASFRFDDLHFTYNAETDDWEVDEDYDGGVLIDFPDEDGTLCTLEFTNKSDYFELPTEWSIMQLLTPSKTKPSSIWRCVRNTMWLPKRGNKVILDGNAKNWLTGDDGKYYSDIKVNINNYNVECFLQDHEDYYRIFVNINKGDNVLISLDMTNNYAQFEDLKFERTSTWNFFNKIEIKGVHGDAIQEAQLMLAAAEATDQATINGYLEKLNALQTLTVNYGANLQKTANMKWGCGKIMSSKYDVLPLVQLASDEEYISILHELKLGDISDALAFINSFDNGILTALLNMFTRQNEWYEQQ